jgi:hypothetical protein
VTQTQQLPPQVARVGGETVMHRWRAGRTQSTHRLVGGALYLTTVRLVFAPHRIEAILSGIYWQGGLDALVDIGLQERDSSQILGGSLRDRLWVRFEDLSVERFVVNDIDAVAHAVESARKTRSD